MTSSSFVVGELNRLRALDGRWVILSSIPGGRKGAAIDQLVIGPGGVFAINARRRAGARAWGGGDLRSGRDEAHRVARILTAMTRICVRVQGLIVPVGTQAEAVKQSSNIVKVVTSSALVDYLLGQPAYLDGAAIARIAGYARLSSTWSVSPEGSLDAGRSQGEYGRPSAF